MKKIDSYKSKEMDSRSDDEISSPDNNRFTVLPKLEENRDEQTPTEEEIIECIDSTLTSLGKAVVYVVYLNWSAVDRENQRGILGDPRSFRASLYGLFGEENGRKIERLLVSRLIKRFPSSELVPSGAREGDFVSVILWLVQRTHDTDTF